MKNIHALQLFLARYLALQGTFTVRAIKVEKNGLSLLDKSEISSPYKK